MNKAVELDDRASIAEFVRDSVDRLTARERKAAQTLLANYPTAGLAPVKPVRTRILEFCTALD